MGRLIGASPAADGAGSYGRILEVAVRVFARHGFLGATTRRIAEGAGVSVGAPAR